MIKTLTKFIKNFFKHNLIAKIVTILITFVLWMIVASSQSTVGKFPGTIPVQANNVPTGFAAIIDEEEVEIEVMAEPVVWNNLSAESFTAFVDTSGLDAGTYELEVSVSSTENDITITKVNPSKIFVRIEKIVVQKLPVTHRIEGSAAEGLVPGNVELVPSEVEVRGPSSQVEKINEVNIVITLNGESNDFERLEKVVVFGSDGKAISDLEFSPTEVLAKTSLVKASNNKTVGVKVKTTGSPKDGYYVSKVTVTPSVVDITGPLNILRGINYIETDPVDLTGSSVTMERDAFLDIVDGTALQRGQSSKVRIIVELAQDQSNKVVDLNIVPINLSSDLRFSYTPISVKVVVSGTSEELSFVGPSDIKYEVNLTDKPSGTYTFDISTDSIQKPDNISITNLVPGSISVLLEPK